MPLPPPSGIPDIDAHRRLIEAARAGSPETAALIERLSVKLKTAPQDWEAPGKRSGLTGRTAICGSTLSRDAAMVWDQDFPFATAHDQPVAIQIDGQPEMPMQRVSGTGYWLHLHLHLHRLRLGATHNYGYRSGGRDLGYPTVAGSAMDSYPIAGAGA